MMLFDVFTIFESVWRFILKLNLAVHYCNNVMLKKIDPTSHCISCLPLIILYLPVFWWIICAGLHIMAAYVSLNVNLHSRLYLLSQTFWTICWGNTLNIRRGFKSFVIFRSLLSTQCLWCIGNATVALLLDLLIVLLPSFLPSCVILFP